MILRRLSLRNYRKFRSVDLDFPEGTVGIIGLNGAGKSSLMEAVAWVLFGNEPSIVRTTKESLRTEGIPSSEPCRVSLEFSDGSGNSCQIIRELRGVNLSAKAQAYLNGKLEAKGAKPVTKFTQKLLGMDYSSFFTSVFARQKEIDVFGAEEPHKRKERILKMLGIKAVDLSISFLRKDKNETLLKLSVRRKALVNHDGMDLIELTNKQLQVSIDQLESSELLLSRIGDQIDQAEKEVARSKKDLVRAEKLRDKYESLSRDLVRLKERLNNLNGNRIRIEGELEKAQRKRNRHSELTPSLEKRPLLEEEVKKLHIAKDQVRRKDQIQASLNRYEKELDKLKGHILELESFPEINRDFHGELNELDEKYLKADSDLQTFREKLAGVGNETTHVQKQLSKTDRKKQDITELGPHSKCPTCRRILGADFEELRNKYGSKEEILKATIIELQDKKKNLTISKKAVENLLKALERRKKVLVEKERDIQNKMKALHGLKMEQSEKERIFQELKNEFGSMDAVQFSQELLHQKIHDLNLLKRDEKEFHILNSHLEKVPALKRDLQDLGSKIESMTVELEKIELEIKGLEGAPGDFLRARNDYHNHSTEIVKLAGERKKLETIIAHSHSDANKLNERLRELEEIKAEVSELEDRGQLLSKLDTVMNAFRSDLISRIRPMLEIHSSALLEDFTNSRYNELEMDKDYNIFIRDGASSHPLDRFSGGEMDLANLCLRLAISRVLTLRSGSSIEFIVLDEIFGSQDVLRKRNILTGLLKLSKQYRQVFLVTHIEEVKDKLLHIYSVEENADGTSRVNLLSGARGSEMGSEYVEPHVYGVENIALEDNTVEMKIQNGSGEGREKIGQKTLF